jgi:hypothetical protein
MAGPLAGATRHKEHFTCGEACRHLSPFGVVGGRHVPRGVSHELRPRQGQCAARGIEDAGVHSPGDV